jgi:transcriptional regulator with XRE-family HTH domain
LTETEPPVRPFAAVLDELCTSGRRYSNVELAAAVDVKQSYIAALRTGRKANPRYQLILRLAEYLDVNPAYFVGGQRHRTAPGHPRRSFADALTTLFRLVHQPEEPELTINAVVLKVRGHSRELNDPSWTISPATLESLRTGANDNPSLIHVLALAKAFSAPPAYFFDDELAARMDEQLETYQTMRALGVDTVILRASQHDLKPSVRARILDALTAAFRPDPAARSDHSHSTENTSLPGDLDDSSDQ